MQPFSWIFCICDSLVVSDIQSLSSLTVIGGGHLGTSAKCVLVKSQTPNDFAVAASPTSHGTHIFFQLIMYSLASRPPSSTSSRMVQLLLHSIGSFILGGFSFSCFAFTIIAFRFDYLFYKRPPFHLHHPIKTRSSEDVHVPVYI